MRRVRLKSEPVRNRSASLLNLLIALILAAFLFSAPAANGSPVFHGNIKIKKFHRPGCRYYRCKNCVVIFAARSEALQAGYIPCKVCNP